MTDRVTTLVDLLAHQMDSAFAGEHWHSVLRNLASCTADDWDRVPPGGKRPIREIVSHLGMCKLMWQDQLFGDRRLTWERVEADAGGQWSGSPDEVVALLRQAHQALQASVAGLADNDLPVEREGYWSTPRPLQWSIEIMIQHDLYHAGEINHVRALHQGNDA